ncbi:transcription elongation factor spt4 [Elsinoe australis]|uniref:Transcription elongation factor SPT4 n=1 Tax=Elsinoe australis TaxID=40998 RepID=A0A2P8ABN4_9PEZI|nr:hypothetical protein B9Z65_9087 [Elsinoe australis]TKX27564.1 transcription elongation factor spt4 [Elsinoe australis]
MSSSFVQPSQHKNLRACLICSIVQTTNRFFNSGCPNCESLLELVGSNDAITDCTSQVFEGLITLSDPTSSWVAKWQRLEGYVPGVYAVKVQGNLPDDVLQTVESAGVRYIPRDGTNLNEDQ